MTMTQDGLDLSEARRILTTEARTRLALRQAKARAFLFHTDRKEPAARAWQLVALETISEQEHWEAANIEKYLLLWLRAGIRQITATDDDD